MSFICHEKNHQGKDDFPHLGGRQDFKEDRMEGMAFEGTGHLGNTTELNWNLYCSCLISLYLQNFIMMLCKCFVHCVADLY